MGLDWIGQEGKGKERHIHQKGKTIKEMRPSFVIPQWIEMTISLDGSQSNANQRNRQVLSWVGQKQPTKSCHLFFLPVLELNS